MTPAIAVLFMAVVAGSAFIQTTTGFGFGIVVMAILPFFLPFSAAQMVSVCMSALVNLVTVVKYRREIQYRQLILPVLFGTVGTLAGLLIVRNSAPEVYKRLLGVFLFALAIWFSFFSDRVRIRDTPRNSALIGAFAGVCGGVFSINGPPMVIYYLSTIPDMKQYRATIQTYFLIMNVVNLTARSVLHLFPDNSVSILLLALPMVLLGDLLGLWFGEKINARVMKRCIYIFLAVAGADIALFG